MSINSKIIIYEAVFLSVILLLPAVAIADLTASVITVFIQGGIGSIYVFENVNKLVEEIDATISSILPALICTLSIVVKYRELCSILTKNKVYTVIGLYYISLQFVFILFMDSGCF